MPGFIADCLTGGGLFMLYHINFHGDAGSAPSALACAKHVGPWVTGNLGWLEGLVVGAVSAAAVVLIMVVAITATLLALSGCGILLCRCLFCCCPRVRKWPTSAPIVPPYHRGILPEGYERRKKKDTVDSDRDEDEEEEYHRHDD